MATLRGDKLPPPTNSVTFGAFHSMHCYRNGDVAGGWYPPLRMSSPIQRTHSENPRAVGPLQSALRAASFPRGKLLEGAVGCFHSTDCYQNRDVEGRQVAAPYETSGEAVPFSALLCGQLSLWISGLDSHLWTRGRSVASPSCVVCFIS